MKMSCCTLFFILATIPVVVGVFLYYYINTYAFGSTKVPDELYKDGYYGRGAPKPDDTSIEPYQIREVSDEEIQDLRDRLNKTRYNEPLEDSKDFEFGFHTNYLKVVTDYWANKFDWRKQEKKIKSFDHFQTEIEGIKIHFIHVKPKETSKKVLPLLLVNGWPSNFYEYLSSIEQFNSATNDGKFAYELVIPSIPGYAFSEAPHKKGFNIGECSRIFHKLMVQRLNFDKYYVHGSDWGSAITRFMASMYPTKVLGYHTTTAFPELNGRFLVRTVLAKLMPSIMLDNVEQEKEWLFTIKRDLMFIFRETGYMHIQATKPDTLGTGLNDSPAGLAAYVLEKYSTWTNFEYRFKGDGGLTLKYSLDDLLTIVSMYWFNQNINYSQRLYKETFSNFQVKLPVRDVPTGYTHLANGMLNAPPSFLKPVYGNLVYHTYLNDGGHFFAMEDPKAFVSEVTKFIDTCERIR